MCACVRKCVCVNMHCTGDQGTDSISSNLPTSSWFLQLPLSAQAERGRGREGRQREGGEREGERGREGRDRKESGGESGREREKRAGKGMEGRERKRHNRHCGILTHDPNHIIGMTSFTM